MNITAPSNLQVVGNELNVVVNVTSTLDISSVVAKVGAAQNTLTFSASPFNGTIDLSTIADDTVELEVIATDINNNTASSKIKIIHDLPPTLTVTGPLNASWATPTINVKANCSDGGKDCFISMFTSTETLSYTKNTVDAQFDLSQYNGTKVALRFTATDSRGQTSPSITRDVWVEASPYLNKFVELPNIIGAFDDQRIGFFEVTPVGTMIGTYDTQTTAMASVAIDDTADKIFLTPTGAGFRGVGALYDWDGNTVAHIGSGLPARVDVQGDYAMWFDRGVSNNTGYYLLYRFSDKSTDTLATFTNPGSDSDYPDSFDLAEDGTAVFLDGAIISHKNGVDTQITTGSQLSTQNIGPVTDGTLYMYLKAPFCCTAEYQVAINDGTTETILREFQMPKDVYGSYQLNNGYAAFTKHGNLGQDQIWLRTPDGDIRQITFFGQSSALELLTSSGDMSFVSGGLRYLANKSGHIRAISSGLGKVYWENNKWYVTLGRVLTEVDTVSQDISLTDLHKAMHRDTVVSISVSDFESSFSGPGEMISISVETGPHHGKLRNMTGDLAPPVVIQRSKIDSFQYIPNEGYIGLDTFTWKISNGVEFTDIANAIITVSDVVAGIESGLSDRAVFVYPNPASDHLILSGLQKADDLRAIITNAQGQKLLLLPSSIHNMDGTYSFDIDTINPGIYILWVSSGEQTVVRRFVKK